MIAYRFVLGRLVLVLLVFFLFEQKSLSAQAIDPESLPSTSSSKVNDRYNRLLEYSESGDSLMMAEMLHKISTQYSSRNRWKRGLEFARRALEISQKIKVDSLLASSYNALAIGYTSKSRNLLKSNKITEDEYLGLADSAVGFYQQKLKVLENLGLPLYQVYTYQGLGQIYRKTEKFRKQDQLKALKSFEKAKKIALESDQKELIITSTIWLSTFYNKVGESAKASENLDEIESIINDYGSQMHIHMFHNLRFVLKLRIYEDEELELLYYKQKVSFENHLRQNFESSIAVLDRRYETQKTKRELAQQAKINDLQKAQLNQRNLIISIVVLLLLGAGGGSFFLYRLNTKNRKLAENNAMLVKEQNHRVKNNLQMISSLLSLQADRSTDSSRETMLDSSRRVQAIALLHRKLYDDLEGVKEVEMKPYIEELIEDILFATGKQDVPHRLNLDDVKLPVEKAVHLALILNELVTNSLKHVFSRERLNGECIELSLSKPNGKIELSYRDYGGSFDVEAFKNSDSLGNQIIQSQANYLAEEVEITDEGGMNFEMRFG